MNLQEILEAYGALTPEKQEEAKKLAMEATKDKRFVPNPGPQTEAYFSQADELFYGGAAGGGKSALICGLAIEEHERSIIFRREYPQIKGLVDEVAGLMGHRNGYNGQDRVWRFDDKVLEFGSVTYEQDKEKYQGRAHDLKAFDEITQFTKSMYQYIIGWNRSTNKEQRCRVVVTGNPPMTAEGLWVIQYWAPWLDPQHPNPAEPGELRWFITLDGEDQEVDKDYVSPDGDRPRSRTFIGSKLEDNPELMNSGYASVLASMPEPMRTMLREGRFDVSTGDDPWQVIPTDWIIQAQERWKEHPGRGYQMDAIGVDIAQGGDDKTVLSPRRGNYFDELAVFKGSETPDGPSVAEKVLRVIRDEAKIIVDAGGGYGGDTLTQLTQAGIDARPFNGAKSSANTTRDGVHGFINLRAQAYWNFREALDPDYGSNICLPPGTELMSDLTAAHYEITPRGIKIESKEDIRKRIGRSPDMADAVIYAYASQAAGLGKVKKLKNPVTSGKMQVRANTSKQRSRIRRSR